MPESRGRKRKKQPQDRKPPQLPRQKPSRRLIVGIWIGLLAIATLLGGAAAVVTFLPRVSIEPPGPFDPTRPLAASFRIANNNFVPLDDGEVGIFVCNIFTQPVRYGIHRCEADPTATLATLPIRMARWKFSRISMDEKFDAPLGDVFNITPPRAIFAVDIIVIISYHPWFLPWPRMFSLRFYTRRQDDGQLYWLAITPAENPIY
jgi:hypothetical protein